MAVTTPADVTVHFDGVDEVNVTGNPDDAVAVDAILNGAVHVPPKQFAVTPVKS
jgi:hypothetical protein